MRSHLRTSDFCIKNEYEIEYTLRRRWRSYELFKYFSRAADKLYYSDLRTIEYSGSNVTKPEISGHR